MDAFLHSALLVAIAETGDKTQLLAIFLAARYRKPGAIIVGILAATAANHAAVAGLGLWLGSLSTSPWLRGLLAASFIALGLWALKPDSLEPPKELRGGSAFTATLIAFFLAEMADKTQLATLSLAAQYRDFLPVLLGTTAGMLAANIPAVFLGHALMERIPMRLARYAAALLFIGFGIAEMVKLV